MDRHGARRRRDRGVTLIEAMISIAIVSLVFIALASAFNLGTKSARYGEQNSAATAAADALESDLRAMAMYGISNVTGAFHVGQSITMYPNGASFCGAISGHTSSCATPAAHNRLSGAVVFTVSQVTVSSPRSATIAFTYTDAAGSTGAITIPIRQEAADTSGCDLTNNVTTNCASVNGGS